MNGISTQLNTKPSVSTRDTDEMVGKGSQSKVEQKAESHQAGKNVSSYELQNKEVALELPEEERVAKAVAKLNDYVQNTERKLEFQLDEDSGETVIRVYDKVSDELIRQIPNEEALELAQRLNQEEPLMLFSAQV